VKIRFTPVVILLIFSAVTSSSQYHGEASFPRNGLVLSSFSAFPHLRSETKSRRNTFSSIPGSKVVTYGSLINERTFRIGNRGGDTALNRPGVNYTRLALVGGALLTTMTAVHIYQQNGWWKDNRAPFHFKEDLIYGLSVDKAGHFYGADVIGFLFRKSLVWANFPAEQALWLGSGAGLIFQTFTELEDGFSAWGFDRVDWLCDLGGSLWAPARYYVPFLRTFDLKVSYHPSDLLGNPGGIGFKGQKHIIVDDYEGQTFWLSVKIEDILPKSVKSAWPDFLCIALGYGARSVADPDPYRVLFVAPDIDFTRLIPGSTSFLRTLGEALNFIHPPLPAVRIYPTTIWYGIYF